MGTLTTKSAIRTSQSIAPTTGITPDSKTLTRKAMKTLNIWRLTIGLAVGVVFSPHGAGAGPATNSRVRFSVETTMVNTGVTPRASGLIEVTLNRKGIANNQRLLIMLTRLDFNTTYQLIAFLGDDTNATSLATFTTDRRGASSISYREPLPPALDPMCNVRELDIANSNLDIVLQGVLTSPDQGQYLVNRSMNNTGFLPAAAGDLQIQAGPNFTLFRLQASGLTPRTDYRLTINGNVVQAAMSDRAGKLNLAGLPLESPDVLNIQTVALTDSTGSNVVLISGGLGIPCTTAAQAPLPLGAAANFVVLAGSTVANTGLTMVNGDLGLSPGSAVTGFPPGTVTGTQHVTDITAAQAQLDLTTAYNDAAGRSVGPISVSGNLGGQTLAPGLYKSTSALEISSGDLTLDAQGDANGVFIFQMASTLTTTAGRQVILSGGAKAANVFWQVGSSATLGTTSVFKGTIMANQSITLTTGATLEGRALTSIGAVTLDSNTITLPAP